MRIEHDVRRTILADRFEGRRFGGPNDVVVRSDGAIYFTDTYGAFRLRDKDPRKELDFNAVYMWKDGRLTLLIKDMPMVNGLRRLELDVRHPLHALRLEPFGVGAQARRASSPPKRFALWAEHPRGGSGERQPRQLRQPLRGRARRHAQGRPAVHRHEGNRARHHRRPAGRHPGQPLRDRPRGMWIISPERRHLGTIRAPEISTNVGFGDADRRTLYIAARTSIYRVRVNVPGI